MTSPLENLCALGHLRAEAPDAKEFAALKQSGLVHLADAEKRSNSLESRFDLTYTAAHALSQAALRYKDYRSANRYIAFQALPHTLGLGSEVWRVLAKGHEIRNRSAYEGDFSVDERLLADLITACRAVAAALDRLPPLAP